MAEVSCYSMDLYCDGKFSGECEAEKIGGLYPATYTGHTHGQCKREAQEEGWLFRRNGEVLCPACSGKVNTRRDDE